MSETISHLLTLETETCCSCSVVFAMPDSLMRRRREDGDLFYCPNGHCQRYGRSDVEKLREELDTAQKNLTQARCETLNERAAREAVEKKLRRVHAGVCPCCKRTFKNLQLHIASKHPDLAPESSRRESMAMGRGKSAANPARI